VHSFLKRHTAVNFYVLSDLRLSFLQLASLARSFDVTFSRVPDGFSFGLGQRRRRFAAATSGEFLRTSGRSQFFFRLFPAPEFLPERAEVPQAFFPPPLLALFWVPLHQISHTICTRRSAARPRQVMRARLRHPFFAEASPPYIPPLQMALPVPFFVRVLRDFDPPPTEPAPSVLR